MTTATISLPQYCPAPDILDDLELLRTGVLHPTDRVEPGGLVSLRLPSAVAEAARAAGGVEIVDLEGVPFARFPAHGAPAGDGALELDARPEFTGRPSPRTFERYYLSPVDNEPYAADAVTVVLDRPLGPSDLVEILGAVGERSVQFLVLAGPSLAAHNPSVATIRSAVTAVARLKRAHLVAIPLDPRSGRAKRERAVAAYARAEVLELADLAIPQRPHGLVLFFTGLSGSGKSTIARSVRDAILEEGERTVTLLDGDLVRRHLSEGLTFSVKDRETNIRRIGWVGAEISRHGGVAICSPIAPFASTRKAVRKMTEEAGGDFLLVHVATPLAECERRDRKGLYAKARRGEIPHFTGISSPYEEPARADLRIDTTGRSIEEAVGEVLSLLRSRGHLTRDEDIEWAI